MQLTDHMITRKVSARWILSLLSENDTVKRIHLSRSLFRRHVREYNMDILSPNEQLKYGFFLLDLETAPQPYVIKK